MDNNIQIIKYKNIDINKIKIYNFDIKYNNEKINDNDFYIQTPIFFEYEILNYNSKKYLELKIQNDNISHIKFLTMIDTIELKLNKFIKNNNYSNNNNNNNNSFKTQIITDIQNKKSLKVKLLDYTKFFDKNKNSVNYLYSKKIIILLKPEFFNYYYSWTVIQILQL